MTNTNGGIEHLFGVAMPRREYEALVKAIEELWRGESEKPAELKWLDAAVR